MSFKARRLRVQLPCGESTVFEEQARGPGCAFPTQVCEGGTCWFETPINCGFVSPCGAFASFCEFPTDCGPTACGPTPCGYLTPCRYGTCRYATCGFLTPCKFGTCGFESPCRYFTAVACPPGTELEVHPGRIVVDPEHLPLLREALERQLKEIEAAEQALKEREESDT
jgi:hypothetical protein